MSEQDIGGIAHISGWQKLCNNLLPHAGLSANTSDSRQQSKVALHHVQALHCTLTHDPQASSLLRFRVITLQMPDLHLEMASMLKLLQDTASSNDAAQIVVTCSTYLNC